MKIRTIATIVVLLLCAVALVAADNPFAGTWKLNAAKSKFTPGPAPQSMTLVIADDKVTVTETNSKGQTITWSYPETPGTTATITGVPDSSVMETRKGNTVDHDWKMGPNTMKGHGVLSKDGKAMTYKIEGTQGEAKQKFKNTEIYEKE